MAEMFLLYYQLVIIKVCFCLPTKSLQQTKRHHRQHWSCDASYCYDREYGEEKGLATVHISQDIIK